MKITQALIAPFLLLVSSNLFAAQSLSTKISGNYSSLRALGMGNAFGAVADDYSLIMYNPAGFARKEHNEVQVTLVGAGVSSKTLTITNDITKASNMTGTDNQKAQAISDVLAQYYGQSLGGKLQALEMFWVRKNWGIAFLPLDLTLDMSINRQLGPAIDLNIKGDTAFAFGYGQQIDKYLDAGITAKYIHRIAVEQSVSALELATDSNVLSEKRFKEGTSIDFDLGFMYTPDWFSNQTNTETVTTTAPTPVVTPAVTEEPKVETPKAEESKKEEERKPQAEEAAKPVDQSTAEKKPEDAAAPAGVVKLGEKTTEEKIKDAVKDEKKPEEAKAAPEVKTEETAIKMNREHYPLKLSMVVHNVIGGEFAQANSINKNATEVPTKNYRVIDIGSQYLLRDGEDFKIRVMVDFQNMLHPEITFTKAFHSGFEFDYSPSGWFKAQLRAGVSQMYFTAGTTLLLGVLNVELATYGEEVGTDGNKIENRVMAAKLGFNF